MSNLAIKRDTAAQASAVDIVGGELFEPERKRRRLGRWLDWAMPPGSDGRPIFRAAGGEARLDKAEAFLAKAPTIDALVEIGMLFTEAASTPATQAQTAIVVATLLDGFPNARPSNAAVYSEALTFVAYEEGLSAYALATATAEIWAGMKFAPTIEEFIVKARDARASFRLAVKQVNHLMEMIYSAEEALVETGRLEGPKWGDMEDDDG